MLAHNMKRYHPHATRQWTKTYPHYADCVYFVMCADSYRMLPFGSSLNKFQFIFAAKLMRLHPIDRFNATAVIAVSQ